MKLIQRCMINGEQVEIADISLVLTLNAAGRGFISVNNLSPEHSLAGAMVQIDLGRDGEAWRYFSGYIERDQPAENGSRRLFIREAAAVLDFDFPCSMQHPTLRGYSIIWGDKAVSFYHSGCGLCQYTNSLHHPQRQRSTTAQPTGASIQYQRLRLAPYAGRFCICGKRS